MRIKNKHCKQFLEGETVVCVCVFVEAGVFVGFVGFAGFAGFVEFEEEEFSEWERRQ